MSFSRNQKIQRQESHRIWVGGIGVLWGGHWGIYGGNIKVWGVSNMYIYIYIYILVLVLERLWGLVTSNTPNRAEELHALSDYCHVKTQSRTLII